MQIYIKFQAISLFTKVGQHSIWGGVAMYISDDFNFKERPDLCINVEGHFESITLEIETKQLRETQSYDIRNI